MSICGISVNGDCNQDDGESPDSGGDGDDVEEVNRPGRVRHWVPAAACRSQEIPYLWNGI